MIMITLRSEADTRAFGARLGERLKSGDCILLRGDLGAGKTTLARAIIRAHAGEAVDVPSPTFSLVEAYEFDTPLYHVDLYRLESPDQVVELGLEDLIETGITLIEWPEKAEGLLPASRLEIVMEEGAEGERLVELTPRGETWARRLDVIVSGAGR